MRYIRELTAAEKQALEYGYKNGKKHYFRIKCKSLLLSNEGSRINELSLFAKKTQRTIRNWFDEFEKSGIGKLEIKPGRGIKAALDSLDDEQILAVKEVLKTRYQKLDTAGAVLSKKFGFKVTKHMLCRFIKKNCPTHGGDLGKV